MAKRFNVSWIPAKQGYIAINPASGDWLLMDPVSRRIIEEWTSGSTVTDILASHPTVLKDDIVALLHQFEERDFTSFEDVAGFHCRDCHAGKFPTLAVLNLTERCNLKCTYCYVRAGEEQVELMKPETAFRIIDEYMAMNPDETSDITMHGGEPLLNWPLVEAIVNYAKPFRDRVNLSIQTNATLLTEERVKFLKDNEVSIGVSIDGPPQFHDRTRVLQNGKGSFDQVMRGIRLLQKGGYAVSTISVLTSHGIGQTDKIIEFFAFNNILSLSLSPMQRIGRGLDDDASALTGEQIFEGFKKAIDTIIAYNSSDEHPDKIFEGKTAQLARNIFYKTKDFMCMRAPCGAGRNILGFGIHGDFYMCDDFINDEEFKIGNVFSGSIKDQMLHSTVLREKMKRSMKDLARCRDCVWRGLCGGECYSSDHYSGANGIKTTEMCIFYRKIIPYLIEMYAENPDMAKLLDYELEKSEKSFFINISEGSESIDCELLEALLKVHSVGMFNDVYLSWNKPSTRELESMLKGIRAKTQSQCLVLDASNPAFQDICSLARAESIGKIRVIAKDESIVKQRLALTDNTTVEAMIPLSIILGSQPGFMDFFSTLEPRHTVVIQCQELSMEDRQSLNTLLKDYDNASLPAKLEVSGITLDDLDTENLMHIHLSEEQPTLFIDEKHLTGVMLENVPDTLPILSDN